MKTTIRIGSLNALITAVRVAMNGGSRMISWISLFPLLLFHAVGLRVTPGGGVYAPRFANKEAACGLLPPGNLSRGGYQGGSFHLILQATMNSLVGSRGIKGMTVVTISGDNVRGEKA